MRPYALLLALVAVHIAARPALAQPAESATDQMEALAWLVGTWRADATTPDGSPETTEVTYEWTAHKKAIRYSIIRTSNGKSVPALAGICGWHPVKRHFVLWEVDGEGNLTEGRFLVSGRKNSHEEVIYGVDGSTLSVRAEVLRRSEEEFQFNAAVEKNGAWSVVFERTYLRVKP